MAVASVHSAPRIGRWLAYARLRHWWHFLPLPLAGVSFDAPVTALLTGARGVAIAFAVLAFGYLLNAAADRGSDLDDAKNALIGEAPGALKAHAVSGLFAVVALGLAATGSMWGLVATVVSVTSGLVYSVGPRLKARPVLGTALNLTNFAPLLLVATPSEGPPRGFVPLLIAFAALLLQNQLLHEAADAREDHGAGVRTTWLTVGPRPAALVTAVAGLALTGTVGLASRASLDAVGVASTLATALIFVVAVPLALVWRGRDGAAMARLRKAHRVASLLCGAALYVALYAMARV
jgi:4-hydroxybenzoate polyprenyltransferase